MTNAEIIAHLRRVAGDKAAKDNRMSLPDDFLEGIAANALVDLEAKLANAERRAEDAETRNDFLLSEIDEIIKRERQRT